MIPFTALVLAGSRRGGDALANDLGIESKALIDVGGKPMLARVVEALRAAGATRVAVAASDRQVMALARDIGCEVVPAAAGPSESAALGFQLLGAPMLLTTADHALLKPEWVTDFLEQAGSDSDVAVLLARRQTIEEAAPDTARTYLRFADGDWSGCNLFLLSTGRGDEALALWRSVEADRKRPWRLVARLGVALLMRYFARRLTLAQGLSRLGSQAGLRAKAVESPFGLAAVDVDKPDDLALARRLV